MACKHSNPMTCDICKEAEHALQVEERIKEMREESRVSALSPTGKETLTIKPLKDFSISVIHSSRRQKILDVSFWVLVILCIFATGVFLGIVIK